MLVYPINVAHSIPVTMCHNESIVLIQIGPILSTIEKGCGVCLSFPYYCTRIITFMNIHKVAGKLGFITALNYAEQQFLVRKLSLMYYRTVDFTFKSQQRNHRKGSSYYINFKSRILKDLNFFFAVAKFWSRLILNVRSF